MRRILIAGSSLLVAAACGGDGTSPSSPCSSGSTTVSLAVGQTAAAAVTSAAACLTVSTTSGTGDYLVVTANADTNESDANSSATLASRVLPRIGLEPHIRSFERNRLIPAAARQAQAAGALVVPRRPSAVTVGQQVQYRVPLADSNNLCASFTTVTATVEAVGAHGIILQDNTAPANGFSPTDFANLSTEFDNIVYPTDTVHYGGPSDIDANGHVIVLFTPEINKLSSGDGNNGFTGGFFFAGDLFPRGQPTGTGNTTCYESNVGEIFYLLAPDPTGTFGLVHTTSDVYLLSRGTLAHEFQHMINAGNRLFKSNAPNFEQVWLDEGLAHFAEEFVGRAELGVTDLQPLTYAAVTANPDDYSSFFFQNFARYQAWLHDPSAGVVDTSVASSLAGRGGIWSLLRHTADRFAGGDVASFTRSIAFGPDTGTQNIDEHVSQPWSTVLETWSIANDVGAGDSTYSFLSWDMRNALTSFSGGSFPLVINGYPPSSAVSLPPAGVAYYTLHVSSGATHSVHISNAAATTRIYILRVD